MLSGASGCGKSTVSLLLANAIVNEKPFLGLETSKRKVLIVDRENGCAVYKSRFERLKIEKNEDLKYWGGWEANFQPEGPEFPGYKPLAEDGVVLIFDSFISFLEKGSEQDSSDIRRYTTFYRNLARAGATVLFIHHTGKSQESRDYRGSSGIKDDVDAHWLLTCNTSNLHRAKLKCRKMREGLGDEPSYLFNLEDTDFVLLETQFIPDTDPEWQQVHDVVTNNPGSNQQRICKLLPNISDPRIRRILEAGVAKKSLSLTKGLKNSSLYFPPKN